MAQEDEKIGIGATGTVDKSTLFPLSSRVDEATQILACKGCVDVDSVSPG